MIEKSFFWKVPGRMGMIVTLYLIHTNVYNSVEAPDNRRFSYIEVWMLGTQIPILLALIQYGIILYWKKIAKKANKVQQENGNDHGADIDEIIKKLDLISMITIFLCFITFILYYIVATTYLNSKWTIERTNEKKSIIQSKCDYRVIVNKCFFEFKFRFCQ